jgi:hypothetical protein
MRPGQARFTKKEWTIIRSCRTPYRVQQYLNVLPYNAEKDGETLRSFRQVVRHGTAHCLEAALAAAVILEQNAFAPLLLDLESQDDLDHVLFLYQRDGMWGTVGRSRDPGLHGRKPVFRRLRDLVDSYADPFVDFTGRIVGYGVCALDDLGRYDWRLSRRNVWRVQRHLTEMPHGRFHMTNQRYRYWRERYLAYKKRFPDRKPIYYPNRGTWEAGYPRGRSGM